MAKKIKISNGDLTALFYERIRASDGGSEQAIGLAIAPVQPSGWTALIMPSQRKKHPQLAKRVEAIQKQLRATYVLARD